MAGEIILDWHIYVIVGAFILCDIVTGLAKAYKNGGYNSTVLREGLYHKFTYIIIMVLAFLIEYGALYLDLPYKVGFIQPSIAVYICVTEICSILENAIAINPELGNETFQNLFGKDK